MDRCPFYADGAHCTGQKTCPRCQCFGDITECEKEDKVACPLTPELMFKNSLRIALKECVKDFVKIYLIDDYVRIDLYHCGDYSYCHIIHNISDKLAEGLDPVVAAGIIAECYKGVILNRYFKK